MSSLNELPWPKATWESNKVTLAKSHVKLAVLLKYFVLIEKNDTKYML